MAYSAPSGIPGAFLPVRNENTDLAAAIHAHAKAMLEVAAAIREHTAAIAEPADEPEQESQRYYMDGTRIV